MIFIKCVQKTDRTTYPCAARIVMPFPYIVSSSYSLIPHPNAIQALVDSTSAPFEAITVEVEVSSQGVSTLGPALVT